MHGRTSSMRAGSWRFLGVVVLTVVFVLALAGAALATDYYVDSVGGSDSNSGTSSSSPWQSLNKLNYTNWPTSPYTPRVYVPGDTINLKCNSVWNNQTLYLYDNGSCTSSSYVTVQSYSTGNKPKINGGEWHAVTNVNNMAARMNTSSASATKRISLPSGKVLKAISIGKRAGTFTGTWKLVSSGNPTIGPIPFPSGPPALPAMDYATGWTTASANVDITVSITSGSANASYVSFDRFLIGDPGSSTNDKLVDLADLARGQGVTLNGWHPDTNGVNFGTNLWKGRQTDADFPSGGFGFEFPDRRNRISGWKIVGIEATSTNSQNPDKLPWTVGTTGIGLAADENGNICKFLEILDCVIHDTSACGINLQAFGDDVVPTSGIFENIHIRNCDVYNIGTTGIQLFPAGWYDPNPIDNFNAPLIECSRVHDIGRQGIMLNNTKNAMVRANEVYLCGNATVKPPGGYSQAAVEAHDSQAAIFQCNRVHNNHDGGCGGDGDGFDFDWNTRYSIMQYNASWENDGAGYFLCGSGSTYGNNIIRFNWSYNDGGGAPVPAGGIASFFSVYYCQIYNNTVINAFATPLILFGGGYGNVIANNVFFTNNSSWPEVVRHYNFDPVGYSYVFENNLYWHLSGSSTNRFVRYYGYWNGDVWTEYPEAWRDFAGWETLVGGTNELWSNPLLVNPSSPPIPWGTGDIHLQTGSPCIDGGITLTDMGSSDYYGQPLVVPLEIGAAMYAGGGAPDVTVTFRDIVGDGTPINGWEDDPSPYGINFYTGYWAGSSHGLEYYGLDSGEIAYIIGSYQQTDVTRRISLPENKVLKRVDIGALGIQGWVQFSDPASQNPTRVVDLSTCPQTYTLNWTIPSPDVDITIHIEFNGVSCCCVSQVGFDNFVFGE